MALFDKLDSLAPAYLMRRRSGDLIALASQDVETVEYFFAHTVAPALVAVLVPSAVLIALAVVAWPIALALLPFVLFAALAPVLTRAHIDHLGAQARDALGLMSAYITETIQGLADLVAFQAVTGRRRNFIELVRGYQKIRLELLARSVGPDGAARNRDRARRTCGRDRRCAARRRAPSRCRPPCPC